jgi:23S rRNA-/tRNA-specific pseudouridylate synthase
VGLPILGDPVYGKPPRAGRTVSAARPVHGRPLAQRPMLHAFRLAFAHPVTGERVAVESTPPQDFQKALAALRRLGPR